MGLKFDTVMGNTPTGGRRTWGDGRTMPCTAKVRWSLDQTPAIEDGSRITNSTASDVTSGAMEQYTRVTGRRTRCMATAATRTVKRIAGKANFATACSTTVAQRYLCDDERGGVESPETAAAAALYCLSGCACGRAWGVSHLVGGKNNFDVLSLLTFSSHFFSAVLSSENREGERGQGTGGHWIYISSDSRKTTVTLGIPHLPKCVDSPAFLTSRVEARLQGGKGLFRWSRYV